MVWGVCLSLIFSRKTKTKMAKSKDKEYLDLICIAEIIKRMSYSTVESVNNLLKERGCKLELKELTNEQKQTKNENSL